VGKGTGGVNGFVDYEIEDILELRALLQKLGGGNLHP
jgi:hypothetical protein